MCERARLKSCRKCSKKDAGFSPWGNKQLTSILNKAKIATQPGGRPPVAVELAPDGVLAAALPGPGQPAVYAFEPLPAGALIPNIGEPNLRAPEVIAAAIRTALGQVSPRTRSITVILPDTLVRVFVLDFDTLPSKAAEAIPVLRFRLRKMVPFDVEHAGLTYQILSESKSETKVLAAVIPGPILTEYEAAVRAAGYEPGAVLSSSLAALEAIDSMESVLGANLSALALTTSIANGSDLLLYRTLDLPEDPELRMLEVKRGVAVACAYFEDKLGARPSKLHFSANRGACAGGPEEFASWIDDPELTVVELAPHPDTGAASAIGNTSIAGVAGALAGVR
jgi:type IV pilus assembly protein PilM